MKGSKEKNNLIINTTSSTSVTSDCFTSILQRLACGGNVISPTTPSNHQHRHLALPGLKSNGCVHPNPNVVPTSANSQFLDHSRSFEGARPGLVARLMGLESMPDCPNLGFMNLRSKSLNSLHWYIFPDTFLDHVTPSPPFSQHQRRQQCHRRTQTSSSVLCVETEKRTGNGELSKRVTIDGENEKNTSKKSDEKGSVIGRRKALGNKVDASKCKVSEDHCNRKCGNRRGDSIVDKRREIKYTDFGTKSRKGKEELKLKVDEKRTINPVYVYDHRHDYSGATKSNSNKARRRRRLPRRIIMDRRDSTDQVPAQSHNQEPNSSGFRGEKLCTKTRKGAKDGMELMAQISRLTQVCVKGNEWINLDENVKGLGVVFAGEMLEVLIDQFLDELLVG